MSILEKIIITNTIEINKMDHFYWITFAPNTSDSLKNQLIQQKFEILMGNTTLEGNYPNNIAYNVAGIGEIRIKFCWQAWKKDYCIEGYEPIRFRKYYSFKINQIE